MCVVRAARFSYQLQAVLDAWLLVVGLISQKGRRTPYVAPLEVGITASQAMIEFFIESWPLD